MRKNLIRLGCASAIAAGVFAVAPGTAQAEGGNCIWVNQLGDLHEYNEGDVLEILINGVWESWRCNGGSWEYTGPLPQ
jgi:hypothetical protein